MQKKLADLEINIRVNFAKQEVLNKILKNQISKDKDQDGDNQHSSSAHVPVSH